MTATTDGPAGALAPFRHRAFALLWTATVISNVGTWMHDVAAGWLMASLAPSPLMVALVQAANTLPVVLLALPAGALADIVDRRRLLLAVKAASLAAAAALGVLAALDLVTPLVLLLFTLALGAGAALIAPTWQAIVPELVPRADLQPAVALNSVGINLARAVGPALGGAVIVAAGIAWPFLLNALSFVVVIVALLVWKRPARADRLPPERLGPAMVTGLRFAAASAGLRAVLLRSGAFFLFASAYWALLPLVARTSFSGGADLYGLMVTLIGAGGVAGAFLLPRLRATLSADGIVAGGTLATAAAMAALALSPTAVLALVTMPVLGAAWIAVLSSLNAAAQGVLPAWVRARGLSLNITVFYAGMTVGSLLWGGVAQAAGIGTALLAAAAGAALAVPFVRGSRLDAAAGLDLAPAMHWPAPVVAAPPEGERGPVMVTIAYRVAPSDREAFLAAVGALRLERRRDGAYEWSIWQDAADPERWIESFRVASWLDHLRQHERVTRADADVQARVAAFHRGDAPPRVEHWLAG